MYYGRKAEPTASKVLYAREKSDNLRRHKARLTTMKPSIDNKAPARFKHMERNLKREQMMEDRYAKIEHENRILLSKMSEIMQKSSLDTTSKSFKFGHSLNRTARKKELQRITAENQAILRRIQAATPELSHWKWEEERIQNEKYIASIAEHKDLPILRASRSAVLGTSSSAGSPTRGGRAAAGGGGRRGGDAGGYGDSGMMMGLADGDEGSPMRGSGGARYPGEDFDGGAMGGGGGGGMGGYGGRSAPLLPSMDSEYARASRGRAAAGLGGGDDFPPAGGRGGRLEPLGGGGGGGGGGVGYGARRL